MKRWGWRLGIAPFILFAGLAFHPARAQYPATPQEVPPGEDYPVDLRVGEIFEVCKSGQIICPAVRPICDDLEVVAPVDTPDGLGFKGLKPGTTLCSAGSAGGQRRVFRITVR